MNSPKVYAFSNFSHISFFVDILLDFIPAAFKMTFSPGGENEKVQWKLSNFSFFLCEGTSAS